MPQGRFSSADVLELASPPAAGRFAASDVLEVGAPLEADGFTDPASVHVTEPPLPATAGLTRSRTGELYTTPPIGTTPVLDAPYVGAEQIGRGLHALADAALDTTPVSPSSEPLRRSRTGALYQPPPPIDPRTYTGAADIAEGAMVASEPIIAGAGMAAPVRTVIALTAGAAAAKATTATLLKAGASPQAARLAGDVAGGLAAGLPIAETLRSGVTEAGTAARRAGDAAVARRAAEAEAAGTIPPEPTDIVITPERQQLPAKTEERPITGTPSVPSAPEPMGTFAPTDVVAVAPSPAVEPVEEPAPARLPAPPVRALSPHQEETLQILDELQQSIHGTSEVPTKGNGTFTPDDVVATLESAPQESSSHAVEIGERPEDHLAEHPGNGGERPPAEASGGRLVEQRGPASEPGAEALAPSEPPRVGELDTRKVTPRDRFVQTYTKTLTDAITKTPADYAYPVAQVPTVVQKMADAIARGTANVQSPALKAAAKQLGLKKANLSAWRTFLQSTEGVEYHPQAYGHPHTALERVRAAEKADLTKYNAVNIEALYRDIADARTIPELSSDDDALLTRVHTRLTDHEFEQHRADALPAYRSAVDAAQDDDSLDVQATAAQAELAALDFDVLKPSQITDDRLAAVLNGEDDLRGAIREYVPKIADEDVNRYFDTIRREQLRRAGQGEMSFDGEPTSHIPNPKPVRATSAAVAKGVATPPVEAQTTTEKVHAVPAEPVDRGALAGTPPEDGEGARSAGPSEPGGGERGGVDRSRGEPVDSAGPAGAAGNGAPPRDVGVPPGGGGRSGPPERPEPPRDFQLTVKDADTIAIGGAKQRVAANLDAITLLKRIEADGRLATPEEQATLAKYVGWGGLSNAFNAKHKDYSPALRALLTDTEYEAARASTPNAHYTALPVIQAIYDGLAHLGVRGPVRFLEPAAGVGHFLGMMPPELASLASRQAVEMDSLSGRIATLLYPNARVQVTPFQQATLPEGVFDLVVSNVPFGNYQVADKAFAKRPKVLTSSIHNYYFAKALDLVRPGGVVAFITSHYTMDAKSPAVREYLADRAKLLGAIRLPNTAFKGNAGTEVVTDIIFLQRKQTAAEQVPRTWVSSELSGLEGGHHINKYFIDHPEMVLGRHANTGSMHSDNEYTVEPTGHLATQLAEAMPRLPAATYDPPTTIAATPTVEQQLPSAPVPPGIREHAWYQDEQGHLYVRENGVGVRMALSPKDTARVNGLIGVRDALRHTMEQMLSPHTTDAAIRGAQQVLNRTYDAFVDKYGHVSKRSNVLALAEDPDVYTLLALEEWTPKAKAPEKAAIFTKRTLQPHTPIAHVGTPKEAMLVSLNETGRIDWDRMAALTGDSVDHLQAALDGLVYHDPTTDQWEQADRYLSGNVKAKLKSAEKAARKNATYAANVEALKKVQPADLEPTDIAVRLGSPWVPSDVLDTFVDHLGLPGLTFRYSPAMAKWSVNTQRFYGAYSVQNTSQWGTDRKGAHQLLDAALNMGDPIVYDTVRTPEGEKRVVNQQATIAAREKQEAMNEEFRQWIWADPARATRLAKIYNDTMNTMRLWEPDGSHLSLPGTNPAIQFRPHQKNFIWRGLQQPNTLAHHVVGAGKTFAGIALALEKRRMGLARKPMVVVPNHLVRQWARDVLRLYPAARVLASRKKDFEPENRKRFLSRIATGDWDAVIVPMSHFGKIRVGDETFNAHVRRELASYERELRRAREEAGKNDPSVKELEKAKLNLEAKLRTTKEKQAKDEDVIPFEQLGVDMVIVDEAHNYKKLAFPTKMTRVAGVPAGGSQRAFDLAVKSGYLTRTNPTGGTVFLTGTPISNTMAEMYVLMRYLAQAALDERGIPQFDGWAATFGEKVTAFEISPTGRGFRQKTRFAKFTNLPELVQMYRAFADVQTADMLKLPTPPLKGGKAQVHTVPASPDLDAFVDELLERFERVLGRKGQKPDPRVDNPLKITTDGRKAALDLRLVGLDQPSGGKVDDSAGRIVSLWKQYGKARGTQLVFADLGTPAKRGQQAGFVVYDALRDALVDRGIPKDQIAFIQEAKTDLQKQSLFDAMNAGDVRVLVGSSETMGAGMNVQQRLVALHHLDAPWRPADIEQREGRILRQGNDFLDKDSDIYDPNFEVEIHTYVTERSFDAYLWQLLENKARFIQQALKGDVTSRETDDADDIVLNFAQAKGAASGNPAIMEHAKTQSDVQRLEASEANFDRRKWRLQRELASLPEEIASAEAALANAHAIAKALQLPDRKDFTITIDGAALHGQEAAEAILAKFTVSETGRRTSVGASTFETPEVAIGRAADLDVRGYWRLSDVGKGELARTARWVIVAGDGRMEKQAATGAGAMTSLYAFLERMPREDVEHWTNTLATRQSSLAAAKTEYAKSFPHAERLKELRARLGELEKSLNLDAAAQAKEAAEAGTIVQTKAEEKADRDAEREDEDDDSDVAEDLGGGGGDASIGDYAEPNVGVTTQTAPAGPGRIPPGHPSGVARPIEFPELVDLARTLINTPSVVASFRKAEKRGEFRGLQGIRLAADLFTPGNEYQAAATLAHEIGHLIDWLPDYTLKRGNVLGRLQTLSRFLKHSFTAPDGSTVKLKAVREELVALSATWRPWDRATAKASMIAYRDSARELYADAISVLLNNPGMLEHEAPTFYKQFFDLLDEKPDVEAAYFDLQEVLAGTPEELVARRRAGVRRMFEEGDVKALELERRRLAELKQRGKDLWFRLRTQLVDKNYRVIDRVRELERRGVRIPEDDDPRYFLEERNYLGGKMKAFVERHFAPVFQALQAEDIPWHAFGESLFYERILAGDRSELANPRGLSPSTVADLYDSVKRELGPARTRVLQQQMQAFRTVVKDIAAEAHDAGLYTDELYKQMQANPAYVTYQVLDHLENGVTSRVHRQIGTLKDIANVADATILKTLVTLRAIEHNRVTTSVLDFLGQHYPTEIANAKTVWSGKGHRPIESRDPNEKLITYFADGHLVGKYVDPYVADALNNESVGRNFAVVSILRMVNTGIFRPVFTTFNFGFQSFNAIRDFLRFWKNVPGMTLPRAMRRYVEAVPLARLRGFGVPKAPLTSKQLQAYKDLLDAEDMKLLSVTFNDLIAGRQVADTQIEDIFARSGVPGQHVTPRTPWLKPLRVLLEWIKETGDFIETLPKAAGIYEFKGTGAIADISPAQRSFIRRKIGSPDFLAGGTWKPVTNEVFLFSNAIVQAVRSDLEVATEPRTRSGFWWKTAKANLLPKILMYAALAGLLGETLKRLMARTTEYDRTSYVVIPLGDDGHGNTVYVRVPQDDSGRLIGGVFWKVLRMASGDRQIADSLAQIIDYGAGQFPSVSPAIQTATTLEQLASNQNPYDAYRGRNLFTDDEWRARDLSHTAKKFVGWEFQNLGGGIVWKFYPGEQRPKAETAGQTILDLPVLSNILGRFIRITSAGETEDYRAVQQDVQRGEARARLDEKAAVGAEIRRFRSLPANDQGAPARAVITAAGRLAATLYPNDPAEAVRRAPELRQMLQMGLLRTENDPMIDAILSATSNKQKLAILRRAIETGRMPTAKASGQ